MLPVIAEGKRRIQPLYFIFFSEYRPAGKMSAAVSTKELFKGDWLYITALAPAGGLSVVNGFSLTRYGPLVRLPINLHAGLSLH